MADTNTQERWLVRFEDGDKYPTCGVCGTPILRTGRFVNPKFGDPGEDDYQCPDHPGTTEWREADDE